MTSRLVRKFPVAFIVLTIAYGIAACNLQAPPNIPSAPSLEDTARSDGIVIHAKVADPKLEYISRFEITDAHSSQEFKFEGNDPIRALLFVAHTGRHDGQVYDEAKGFDQFLLGPQKDDTSSFVIDAGTSYKAMACSSRGMCQSMTFTLGKKSR